MSCAAHSDHDYHTSVGSLQSPMMQDSQLWAKATLQSLNIIYYEEKFLELFSTPSIETNKSFLINRVNQNFSFSSHSSYPEIRLSRQQGYLTPALPGNFLTPLVKTQPSSTFYNFHIHNSQEIHQQGSFMEPREEPKKSLLKNKYLCSWNCYSNLGLKENGK